MRKKSKEKKVRGRIKMAIGNWREGKRERVKEGERERERERERKRERETERVR